MHIRRRDNKHNSNKSATTSREDRLQTNQPQSGQKTETETKNHLSWVGDWAGPLGFLLFYAPFLGRYDYDFDGRNIFIGHNTQNWRC